MKSAKKTDHRNGRVGVAESDDVNRETSMADGDFAGNLRLEMTPAIPNDGLQFEQFMEVRVSHVSQFRITLEERVGLQQEAGLTRSQR